MFLFSYFISFASEIGDGQKKDENSIVPIVVTVEPEDFHRSITPEIDAYFLNGYVVISFTGAQDFVVVTVRNLTSGRHVQNFFDTSCMSANIDIRDIVTSGDYIIEFDFANFDTYVGEFSL